MEENKLIYLLKKEITKNHTKYDAETLDKMFNEGKRDEIIKSLLPLVLYVSGSFTNQYQYEDFISVGNIGLIKAVDTYKVESNMNLITYSKYMIRWAILDYIQTDYTFILYPRKKKHYVKEKPPKLERVEYQQEKHIEIEDEIHTPIMFDKNTIIELLMTLPNMKYHKADIFYDFYSGKKYQKELGNQYNMTRQNVSLIARGVLKSLNNDPILKSKIFNLLS